jgi:hypothetical protein
VLKRNGVRERGTYQTKQSSNIILAETEYKKPSDIKAEKHHWPTKENKYNP